MTALPTSAGFTEATVTEAQFKNRISELRDYLAGLFGATGTVDVALATLGALAAAVAEKTAAYTVVATDRGKVLSCSGAWTLALPAVAIVGAGFSCVVVNRGSGTVTIDPAGTELINGVATIALLPGHGGLLVCTGAGWISVGVFGNETVAHANGTAAAPSVSFGQDSDTGLFRTAANSLGLATGGVQRVRVHDGGLEVTGAMTGTAVTQSSADPTSGRLLKVGDFGLGGTEISVTPAELDALVATGMYKLNGTIAGILDSGSNILHLSNNGTTLAAQIGFRSGIDIVQMRRMSGGVWQSWREIYTAARVIGSVSQSSGVPTGALAQIGTSASGRFERRASGQMRCQRTDLTVTDMNIAYGAGFRSASITWTFPSAFLTGSLPVISINGAHSDVNGFRIISVSDTAVTFQLTGLVAITGAIPVRAAAEGRWSDMV